jgi:hypothetical protein
MWNYKTLKIQKTFQNVCKILKLQKSFATHKWGKMYMMCWKKMEFIKQEHKNVETKKMVMIWNYYHF